MGKDYVGGRRSSQALSWWGWRRGGAPQSSAPPTSTSLQGYEATLRAAAKAAAAETALRDRYGCRLSRSLQSTHIVSAR